MYLMNVFMAILIPLIFLLTFLYAARKKVKLFDCFTQGVTGAIPLIVSIFPYIVAVSMLSAVFTASGLETWLTQCLSPVFNACGVPTQIAPLLLVKPLSGSGSIAVLSDILQTYGVDSYIARCACVAYGSSETIFYIGAVYFAGLQRKKFTLTLWICVGCYLFSVVVCCLLCRFM